MICFARECVQEQAQVSGVELVDGYLSSENMI